MKPLSVHLGAAEAPPALAVTGLAKSYRDSWGRRFTALSDVTFGIPRGEIFGLLGPNGAGKSTTLKIALGLVRPSSGSGRILDRPVGDVGARERIGFLPENPYFYDHLNPRELLDMCASISALPRSGRRERIAAMLERVGLDPGEKRVLRKFSKGMLQRVGLAQALLHDPELVILDEPMSGLDPVGRRQVRDLILELKAEGKTVLFSSHVLSDVETLCDRVGILVQGVLRRTGRVRDLVSPGSNGFEIEAADLPASLVESWREQDIARRGGDRTLIHVADPARLEERIQQVLRSGGTLLGVRPVQASLEDAFLAALDGATRTASAGPDIRRRGAA